MNLVLHHLRKDVRSLRWWILLWLLSVAVTALPDLLIFQSDYETARAVDGLRSSPFSLLVGFIAWTVLVARLIQTEPITGSTSFWLTRPVPKRVYLLSKFIFLATLVLLPTFLPGLVHDLVFGSDGGTFQTRAITILATQFMGMVGVIWLATFTPNLVYFAGMLCLGVVVLVIESILISMQQHVYGARDSSSVVLVVVGLFVSLLVQHLRRGSRLGLYIGLASLASGIIGLYFAPAAPNSSVDQGAFRFPKTTAVNFEPDWLDTLNWSSTNYGNGQRVPAAFARLKPVTANSGNRIWISNVSARFDVPGEFSGGLGGVGPAFLSIGREQAQNTDLIQARLPGIKLAAQPYPVPASSFLNVGLFNLLGVEDKVRGKTGKLTLNVMGQVLEMKQVAVIPLNDPHFIAHVPGGFLRVRPITSTWAARLLTVWSVGPTDFPGSSQGDYMCVVVDPQTATGKMLRSTGALMMSSGLRITGMREVRDSTCDYALEGSEPLDRMVLHVFQYAPAEEFTTQLVAPNFKMSPTER